MSTARVSEADIRYAFFLTDWDHNTKRHATQHTLTTNEFYKKATADGVLFSEWIRRNVIDDEDMSLGHSLLGTRAQHVASADGNAETPRL